MVCVNTYDLCSKTKITKIAEMTCHIINKAVVMQNCIKALSQHAQPPEKKAALSTFT